MRSVFLLSILLLFTVHAVAAPMKFADHNFSMEMPPGWSTLTPQPADTLLAMQSPGRAQKLLVYAMTRPARNHPDAARELGENAKKGMTKAGYQIGPDQSTTIGDLPFVFFTARVPDGGTMAAYIGSAGDEIYMMEGISKDKDADSEPQLQAALRSFRLLSPPGAFHAPPSAHRSSNHLYLLVIATIVVIGIAGLTFRRLMAKEQ
ncbi:MAG TPA: hypothetical protein VGM54_22700 [Chthoniobacter sp.]|jgi:hypothetical protein